MGMLMPRTPATSSSTTTRSALRSLLHRTAAERDVQPARHIEVRRLLVINQTEALVAIDVNSGKSTREFSIEETAINTNLEASDEIARQLKLRDLAGLIVIDFIDMEERRNNRKVESRLKDALRHDRARIQVGRISHFGLMEMSRQRLRTGVLEGSTSQCPHCQGTGIIRSTESVALAVLRGIEDHLMRDSRSSVTAATTAQVALYILNNKRAYITEMESRFGVSDCRAVQRTYAGRQLLHRTTAAPLQPKKAQQRAAVSMDWGFEGEDQEPVDATEDAGDELTTVSWKMSTTIVPVLAARAMSVARKVAPTSRVPVVAVAVVVVAVAATARPAVPTATAMPNALPGISRAATKTTNARRASMPATRSATRTALRVTNSWPPTAMISSRTAARPASTANHVTHTSKAMEISVAAADAAAVAVAVAATAKAVNHNSAMARLAISLQANPTPPTIATSTTTRRTTAGRKRRAMRTSMPSLAMPVAVISPVTTLVVATSAMPSPTTAIMHIAPRRRQPNPFGQLHLSPSRHHD